MAGRATIKADTNTIGIFCVKKQYVHFVNLNVKGSFEPYNQTGWAFTNNTGIWVLNNSIDLYSGIKIDSCRITNFLNCAIEVTSTVAATLESIHLSYLDIDSIGNFGIFFNGKEEHPYYGIEDVRVTGCRISRVTGLASQLFTGDGILLLSVDSAIVERNLVKDCGGMQNDSGKSGPSAIESAKSRKVIYQYNETYNQKSALGSDGGGMHFGRGVQNSIMQYNYSHDNDGPGFNCHSYVEANDPYPLRDSNNIIRYNISSSNLKKSDYQDGEISISSFNANIYDIRIYNNTIFAVNHPESPGDGAAILIKRYANNVSFWNNIVVTGDSNTYLWYHFPLENSVNINLNGNIYWSLSGVSKFVEGQSIFRSFHDWQTASGKELLNDLNTGIVSDPLVSNIEYHGSVDNPYMLHTLESHMLVNGSVAKEGGLDINALFSQNPGSYDFYSNELPRACNYDIGCHEDTSTLVQISIEAFIQSFYNSTSNTQIEDTITVELRDSNSPYSVLTSSRGLLTSVGRFHSLASWNFGNSNCYLVINHRNCIQTWSSQPIMISPGCIVNYDFKSDSSSVYGNNLKRVDNSPITYAVFSGDVNQDGFVDGSDNSLIENDIALFATGYLTTDLTGDNFVDGDDLQIAEQNSYVESIQP